MIEVKDLEKHYGATRALRGISFDVQQGQVVGFLGPNGAGKTTTMKILTGFLYPHGGTARIAGHDVMAEPLVTRRYVGYLPESNPLYTEMSVLAYLRFAAEIRGVPPGARQAPVGRVGQECGLRGVLGKDLGELSKGYRQRVGLAQAMIHDPQVLILDEPTSGLDPNQIVEIRGLIKRIGESRTVVLSTHYLQEVEATCNRVIIVHRGSIVADGTIPELIAGHGGSLGPIHVGVVGPADQVRQKLNELAGAGNVSDLGPKDGAGRYTVHGLPEGQGVETLFDLLVTRNGWKLVQLHREPPHLETVFRNLTAGSDEPAPAAGGAQGGAR